MTMKYSLALLSLALSATAVSLAQVTVLPGGLDTDNDGNVDIPNPTAVVLPNGDLDLDNDGTADLTKPTATVLPNGDLDLDGDGNADITKPAIPWEVFWDGYLVGPFGASSWYFHDYFGNVWNDVNTESNWTYLEMLGVGSDGWTWHQTQTTPEAFWMFSLRFNSWVFVLGEGDGAFSRINVADSATYTQTGSIFIINPPGGTQNWRVIFQQINNGNRETYLTGPGGNTLLSSIPTGS